MIKIISPIICPDCGTELYTVIRETYYGNRCIIDYENGNILPS
jgi:hypothetical protein